MTTPATYDQFAGWDPTKSFTFRAGQFFNSVLARAKLRLFVEAARLFFLGFYDEFVQFTDKLDAAEAASKNHDEWQSVWNLRIEVTNRIGHLLERLSLLDGARYGGRDLLDYIAGRERLDQLHLFVSATRVDEQTELALQNSKREFVATFGRRKLTRTQRTAFLEKYRQISGVGQQR